MLTRFLRTVLIIDILASTRIKSGVLKDERDTPMRRVRHRDNKLLRGGIGLTTGLGWSDRYILDLTNFQMTSRC